MLKEGLFAPFDYFRNLPSGQKGNPLAKKQVPVRQQEARTGLSTTTHQPAHVPPSQTSCKAQANPLLTLIIHLHWVSLLQ